MEETKVDEQHRFEKNTTLKNRKDRLRYKKRKKFKLKNQKIQRANEMILNKSTITLSDDDKIFLIQDLNFAPTPSWNSKTETTERLNLQSHIRKVDWNNVLSRDVEAVVFQPLPIPLPLPHLLLPLPLPPTKNEKTTVDNFLTFVGL